MYRFFVDKYVDKYVDNLWITFLSTSYPHDIHRVIHTIFCFFDSNINNLKSYPHIHTSNLLQNILIPVFITGFLWITFIFSLQKCLFQGLKKTNQAGKKVIHIFLWISMWITLFLMCLRSYPHFQKSYPQSYPQSYPHGFLIDFNSLSELSTYPQALLLLLLLYI